MAKIAIVFGVLIALVGVVSYVSRHFWHALIPVVLVILLIALGLIAIPKTRNGACWRCTLQ